MKTDTTAIVAADTGVMGASRRAETDGEIAGLFGQWLALEREAIERPYCTKAEEDEYDSRRESVHSRLLSRPASNARELSIKILVDTYFGDFGLGDETIAEACAFAGVPSESLEEVVRATCQGEGA